MQKEKSEFSIVGSGEIGVGCDFAVLGDENVGNRGRLQEHRNGRLKKG